MKLLVRLTTLLVLLAASAQAQLVIYKGTVKKQGPQQGDLNFGQAYQIIDLSSNESKSIDFYPSKTKSKRTYIVEDIINYHFRTYEQGSKSFTFFLYDNSGLDFGLLRSDFTVMNFTLTGQDAELPVGGEASTATFPKLFSARFTVANSDVFANLTGLYTFQAKLTQRENNAGHTIDEAADAIVADLQKQGYVDQTTTR